MRRKEGGERAYPFSSFFYISVITFVRSRIYTLAARSRDKYMYEMEISDHQSNFVQVIQRLQKVKASTDFEQQK